MTERLQTWPEDDLADTSDLAVAHLGRLSACPFQGLMPYTEAEERYFFGRDDDLDMVVANLMASRLVVLYGPSGVGKSSLLRAGVLRQLRQLPTGGFSHLAINQAVVVYQSSWTSDPLTSVGSALREAIPPGLAADAEELVPAGAALSAGLLRRVSERLEAEVYLLFDQFEEIALYTTEPAMRAFAEELGRIVAAPGLRASVLIGIREEALAKLDRFAAHVPGILGNSLRLEHLRPDGARAAIEGPVRQYNAENGPDRAVTIEDGLVEELLAQLRTGRVAAADGGRGGIEDGRTIETPFLQLVMTRLWLEEAFAGSDALRLATLAALGGAEGIVGTHLDAVMADLPEQHLALAAQVMPYLVTPSGSKVASSAESLAYLAGLPSSGALSETLERLSGGTSQILRLVPAPAEQPGPPRYEVFHDVLCPAVLDWQRRYVAAREREAGEASLVQARQAAELRAGQSRRQVRRARLTTGVLLGLALLLAAVAGLAVLANRSARESVVQARLAAYESQIRVDPAAALHAALGAYDLRPGRATESALRTAVAADLSERVLRGHSGPVQTGEYSADGTRVVTGGQDGTVRLFDTASGRQLRVIDPDNRERPSPVVAATLSRDAQQLAVATENGHVRVVDPASGQARFTIEGYDVPVSATWVGAAGAERLLVSAFEGSGTREFPARLYDRTTGSLIAEYGGYQASMSGNGSWVVTVLGGVVSVWDAATGRKNSQSLTLTGAAIEPRFVTASDDTIVLLLRRPGAGLWSVAFWRWRDTAHGQAVREQPQEATRTPKLVVSPDRQHVVVGLDKRAVVYAANGELRMTTPQHPDWVQGAGFSADATMLVTTAADGVARIWAWSFAQVENGPIAHLLGHAGGASAVRFSPADPGALLTTSVDGTARTWQLPEGTVFPGQGGWTLAARLSPDGEKVLLAQRFGHLGMWPVAGNVVDRTIKVPPEYGPLSDAQFTPGGSAIVVAAEKATMPLVFDQYSGSGQAALKPGTSPITGIAISPDSRYVAAGTRTNEVVVWDRWSQGITATLTGRDQGIATDLAYVPGNRGLLAVASSDGKVRIWDPARPEWPQIEMDSPRGQAIRRLAVSPDGARLATLSADQMIRVWRVDSGRLDQSFAGPATSPGDLTFNGDGTLLAAGSADGAVHVYQWRRAVELGTIRRHSAAVNSIEFTAGNRILSSGADGFAASYACSVCRPIEAVVAEARAKDRLHQRS